MVETPDKPDELNDPDLPLAPEETDPTENGEEIGDDEPADDDDDDDGA